MTTEQQTFVIVGAGLAGAKAAEALRAEGFAGRVVLIGEETERPYERPPLSKDYLQGKAEKDKIYVHPRGWYAEHDVELRLGDRGHRPSTGDGPRRQRSPTASGSATTSCCSRPGSPRAA